MRTLAALVAVLLLVTGCSSESGQKKPDSLPDVTLASFTGGQPLDLGRIAGPAVINVWASWCGPCRRELPYYQALSDAYAGRLKVLGVDFQDTRAAQARALIHDTGVRYPLYSDPDGRLRSRALPELILVDGRGRVAYRRYVEIRSQDQLDKLVRDNLGISS